MIEPKPGSTESRPNSPRNRCAGLRRLPHRKQLPGSSKFFEMTDLSFEAIAETTPGAKWQALFSKYWPAYRAWFFSEGDAARKPYLSSYRTLKAAMPELAPIYERLCELAGGGDQAARFLSLYCPPPCLTGCSQVVWSGDGPALIRNYDYAPWLCEGSILCTA